MTISYYDFQNLPDRQAQYDFVITHGRLISERTTFQSKYVLYEVSNFSVELIYNMVHDKIIGLNIFENKSSYFKGH
ncbi:putative ester cyclase [Chryseobacterium sp. PvR013]|nr:putative ester cyclase [Chryseobacterium sp. PvR013]